MIKTRISSLLHVPPDSQVLLCERAILSKSKRIADVVISVRPSPTSLTAVVCSHSLLHHSLSSRYWCSGGTSDGLHRPRRLPYPTLARHQLPYPVRHSFIDRSPSKHLELVHSHTHDVVLAVSAAWWWYHDGCCLYAWFAIKSSTESLDSMIEWNGMECSIRLGESLGQCIIPRLDCESSNRDSVRTRHVYPYVGSTIRTTRCTSM